MGQLREVSLTFSWGISSSFFSILKFYHF
jgi:hypothetical protein